MKLFLLTVLVLWDCTLISAQTPPSEGLYFSLNGLMYLPGDTVFITDIGTFDGPEPPEAGAALVCVTTNVNTQCCRGSDHGGSGPVGFWYNPDGVQITRGNNAGPLFRTGSAEQVRLSRMSGVMGPVGEYQCRVPLPGSTVETEVASINIVLTLPTTESVTTEAATTEAATTEAATTEAPTTEAATTEAPTTEAATTEAATTEAATTEAATTEAATTEAATTEAATSEAATSEAATTEAATTEAPTTEPATTEIATTETVTTEPVPEGGLYFTLRGTIYLPGSTVLITDIGTPGGTEPDQPGGTLVCVTTNVNTQCCRNSDGGTGGDWFFPEGGTVTRGNNADLFFRTGSAQQVRLGRMSGVMEPVGRYECRVLDSNGTEQVAAINILLTLATEGPTTKRPTTEGPTTEGPTTEGPTTEGPTTEGPTTEGPTTEGPTTEGPTTEGPTTEGPTTEGPTTEGPTTGAPMDVCETAANNCAPNATCMSTVGDNFTCTCIPGYTGNGTVCTDIDECTMGTDNCAPEATCMNTEGSFTCTCNLGYTGNGTSCTDIDECAAMTDNCDDTLATCTNTAGSFMCTCIAGYAGDGVTCTDIDECTMGTDDCGPETTATCMNTEGSYTCVCNEGYTGTMCTDINECTMGTDNCAPEATCTNTEGSFTCTCNQGYDGDGFTCTLIIPSSPTAFSSSSPDPTTITLTWTQPAGEVVNQYLITYSFMENDCGFASGRDIDELLPGSSRTHTLDVQENSDYDISIIARNTAGDSPPAVTMETTAIAAPSATPTNLEVASTTPTSITITWGRVPCEDRNVEITQYSGRYGPNRNLPISVIGTSNRMFTATGLVPRTSYSFEVEAAHFDPAAFTSFRGPSATVTGTTAVPTGVGFFLNGMLYPNNSVVALTDIGEAADIEDEDTMTALFCLTDLAACCRGADTGSDGVGEWVLAGQTEAVPGTNVAPSDSSFTRGRAPSAVLLNHRNNAVGPTGIFTCHIPDGSGPRTAYIGIGTGNPSITGLVYNSSSPTPTLTCTSTGGMVDSVTWRKDGVEVGSDFSQLQTITDTLSATYQHTLSSENISNFVGTFTCEVRDTTGFMDQRTMFINGVTISSDRLIVGISQNVTCISDTGVVERIEWQREGQVVVEAASVEQLELVLDPVSDTDHGVQISCIVTRSEQERANQSLTISVTVPPNPLLALVATSGPPVAGSEFSMDCIIVENITGLANMPTAMWLVMEESMVDLSANDNITITTSRNDTVAVATITFDPLRASHGEGGEMYRCSGNLMSPALDSLIEVTTDEQLTVKIPAPTVSLNVTSTGPLLAGGAEDITLTCSALLDLTVVDTQDNILYSFTWRDRAGVEIVSDGPSTIAFSSLTLSPLTTMDTNFTCAVEASVAQNTLLPSDSAMTSISLDVEVPAAPVVDIESTGTSTAGHIYTLTCTVTLLQPLRATPTIMWTNSSGTVIESGDNITVSTPSSGVVILTFDPLLVSHGVEYRCVAEVDIEDGLSLTNSSALGVIVQIPPPTLVITGVPRDEGFHAGLPLTFIARAEFPLAVDTPLSVSGVWSAPDDNSTRVSIVDPVVVQNRPTVYVSNYSLVLDMELDNGTYTFSLDISSAPFLTGTTISRARNISVLPFPPQIVRVTALTGDTPTAGDQYTLVCEASREETLSSSTVLKLMWFTNNATVTSGSDVNITGPGSTMEVNLTSTLTFTRLRTSQGGVYRCAVSMTIPTIVQDHVVSDSAQVSVTIPATTSVTFEPSREGPLYEGTSVNLECSVAVDRDVVDTEVLTAFTFTRTPDVVLSSSNVTGTGVTFTGVAMFNPLISSRDEGQISCESRFLPVENPLYVQGVDNDPEQYLLEIEPLPAPEVKVTTSAPLTIAGGSVSLTCTATVIDNLVVTPDLQWLDPDGSNLVAMNITRSDLVFTRAVELNSLRTSQGGQYRCEATLTIPDGPIALGMASTDVRVQIPPVMLNTMLVGEAVAGTVMSLVGSVTLSPLVNTSVSLSAQWTSQGRTLTVSTTNTTTLTFEPLSRTNTSDYVYMVTVEPDNSTYVESNSANQSFELTVLPYPDLVVVLGVLSGECMTQGMTTLTGDVSASVHPNTSPDYSLEYMWRDPNGDLIMESSNNDFSIEEERLIVRDVGGNTGEYSLTVCITIPGSDVVNHCSMQPGEHSLTTAEPGSVNDLECSSADGSDLVIDWTIPDVNAGNVIDYMVEVLRYVAPEDQIASLSPPFNQQVDGLQTRLGEAVPGVRYVVTVMPRNPAGCGVISNTSCYSEELAPTRSVGNVQAMRSPEDPTIIIVTWEPLTIVEARGFIRYRITLTPSASSKRQELSMEVAMDQSSVEFTGLDPSRGYGASVATIMSDGTPGEVAVSETEVQPAPSSNVVVIVIVIIVILLVVLLIVVVIIIIVVLRVRNNKLAKKGIYSPRHFAEESNTLELKYARTSPTGANNDATAAPFSPAANEKESEAALEVPPSPVTPPTTVTPTEVMDRMKPVSVESFRDHVASKHDERDKGFEAEYQSLGSDPVNQYTVAKLPHNRAKNRFANIFPYDFSRVTLKALPGVEGSDYINACSLDGFSRSECYIAAQGPMPNTEDDFWRMIWEERLSNIVMLTKCTEAGRRKCEQYWAENIGDVYQTPDKKFSVTTTSVMPFADFVIRTFSMKRTTEGAEPFRITQYHFTSWPDHGVPKFATSLISFIRRVQKGHNKDVGKPLLVHCSAGVGRTGTFITLDAMLERIKADKSVNVYEFVRNMRQRRVLMVQTLAQYVFIHDALNEYITCGETEITASNLRAKFTFLSKQIPGKGITGFMNQFQLLEQVSRQPEEEDCTDANEHFNRSKNRYQDKIPYNLSRARLRPNGDDGSEYINASFIDGYKQRNAYIATQGPLKSTVNDLWRMLWEFKSKTMVTLCNFEEEGAESCFPFWPTTENSKVKYGSVYVTLQSTTSYDHFVQRKFSLHDEKVESSPNRDGFVVTQFHLTKWPLHGRPPTGSLIEMLDLITKTQISTGNRPITIMCNDGVGRSGTFICIHSQLERLKTEGIVDLFQSVKSARTQRAGLVPEPSQFAFAHEVLADFIDKFDNYANFKDMI